MHNTFSFVQSIWRAARNNKRAAWCIGLFAIACCSVQCNTTGQRPLPNILLVVSEDHGPHLSCYGDTVIRTPNLDAIASEGMLFRNAYVTQSVCSPSRSSILTGLYPHQNGQLGLATQGYRLVGDVANIYQLLKQKGYRTGMIGKLHVNPADSFPIDFHPIKESNFQKKGLDRYASHAESFMKASEEPFFLMVNFPDAHFPFQDTVEGRPARPVTPEEVAVFPYIGFDNDRIRKITANYYNCLLRLDETVGELWQALARSGKKQNTLVLYLSDHGDEMARGKFDIYEASMRIPFLASWPGKIRSGSTTDALVSTVDIVPTFLSITETVQPNEMSGKSLTPLFEDPGAEFREYLFTEYNCDPILYFPRRAVRDERYKLIYSLLDERDNPTADYYMTNATAAFEGCPTAAELLEAPDSIRRTYQDWVRPGKIQLFDLRADPWEFRNLSEDAAYAGIRERLLAELRRWQEETSDPLLDPEKLGMLTAEHDTVGDWRKKKFWKYPQYLYGDAHVTVALP